MRPTISVSGLSRRYREQLALDEVSFSIDGPSINGLLGRNGAGKTTLLRIVAAQEFPTSGEVRLLGSSPFDGAGALQHLVLIREDQVYPDFKVRHALQAASWFYPNWSSELAEALLDDFALPRNRAVSKLSHGMRSALGAVIGLAARAEITMFDEPYSGLDVVARRLFYDRLLADYAEHPRTVLLSTHLVDEVADLLERVLVVDHGRLVLDGPADELRGSATTVSGPTEAVEAFVAGRRTRGLQRLASRESVVLVEMLDEQARAQARELRLDLRPLSLQQLLVHVADGVPADLAKRTSA